MKELWNKFLEKTKEIKTSGWISILLAVITPVLSYFGMTGEDFTTWEKVGKIIAETASNPYLVSSILINIYCTLQNPTSVGFLGWGNKHGNTNK